jgi:hypothetical protein
MPRTAKHNTPPPDKTHETVNVGPRSRPLRVDAVLRSAEKAGFLTEKNGRVTGRISTELVERAKTRTGIESDTELLAFALANVALEDGFGEAFHDLGATVDPELDLEF